MSDVDQQYLILLYQQMASTMQILGDIQQLEKLEKMENELNKAAEETKALAETGAIPKKPAAKKAYNPFDDDDSDIIRRKDYVAVFVHIEVIRMGEIDTRSQRYECELNVVSRWLEPELDGKQKMFLGKPPTITWDYWEPMTIVRNGVGNITERPTYDVMFDQHDTAMVEEKRYLRGYFKSTLDLYDYPFDKQDLVLKLGTTRAKHELCYKVDPIFHSTLNMHSFSGHHEWDLKDSVKIIPETYTDTIGIKREIKPALTVYFKTSRHPWYFVWNVILFIIIVSSLAFSTFSIDFSKVELRLPLTFILLLSNITFKFAVSKTLPKMSYLTYMDSYVLTSLVIMVILSMWHVSIATIFKYTNGADAKLSTRADYGAMAILCVIYIVFNGVFIAKMKYTKRRARKQKEKREKLERSHQTAHSSV